MTTNERLRKRSDMWQDENGNVIVKRCFFLLCGENDYSDYMSVENAVNIFKRPRDPWHINLKFHLHNSYIEICNDVIKSQTKLLPEFRSFFRYDDLYAC